MSTVEEFILEAIENDYYRVYLFDHIRAVMVKFEGKKVGKTLATAVEKSLPDYTIYYDGSKNRNSSIRIWKGDMTDIFDFNLGRAGTAFSLEGFDFANAKYGSKAKKSIEGNKAFLLDEKKILVLKTHIKQYLEAKAYFENSKELPIMQQVAIEFSIHLYSR